MTETGNLIVVGADGSDHSAGALQWAVAQARMTDAEVLVLTGFDTPMSILVVPTYTGADYARDAEERNLETLRKAFGEHPPKDVSITAEVIQERPALALIGVAERQNASLLVIGSHGHSGFPGLHLGSVAGYCVHHAPCPVLVFRGESVPA